MRTIRGAAFLSLDGVMQAPGGPTEDPTGGFAHGGWLAPIFDEAVGRRIDQLFGGDFDLLLGRRTYDIFAAYWPFAPDAQAAIRDPFDHATKYVLTSGNRALAWRNSERVAGMDDIARVKRTPGPDLVIQGSSTLYPQLLAAGLLDTLTLMVFPVVLGAGKRLFGDGTPPRMLDMIEQEVTPAGTVIATYRPGGAVGTGSFAHPEPSPAEVERQQRIADGRW
ncbi:MAG: dihydrofolate reductase family protein [Alphaproteobacteria bacterium]|nr:dihydrofolate reductase family protein [Alphaproteobacteria bacterium]